MLLCMYSRPSRGSGPLRTGFVCGIVGVLVALVSDLYFLFVDPADTSGWVLAVIAQYRTRLALAAFLLLAILAALRVRPTHLDPGVPYRSLLLRDGALAATVVAAMVGFTLFLKERGASPERVRDIPPPAQVSEVEATLQPPSLRDLGRSMANFVLRAVLLGTVGGLVGALRGRPSLSDEKPRGAPRRE